MVAAEMVRLRQLAAEVSALRAEQAELSRQIMKTQETAPRNERYTSVRECPKTTTESIR